MSSELFWAVARMLVALPLVLGAAYLFLKYGLARRYSMAPVNRRMKLVEQLPLGPKATLSLISLGEKYYLLAHQQDSSINLVKELDALPQDGELKAGDIVELTPRTIGEFDRMQKVDVTGKNEFLPEQIRQKLSIPLNKLAGSAARARGILTERLAPIMRASEKGGKKR